MWVVPFFMARPIKNNADYFPHDADMRNDPRVKALRRKFGIEGYGIYCMVVEYLTDAEHFKASIDKLGIELMSGDFDIDVDKLQSVLNYCTQIDLFQLKDNFLRCNSLEKRLNPLLSKREGDRNRVIANYRSENRDSKVKKSRVKKSKLDESNDQTTTLGTGEKYFIVSNDDPHSKKYRIQGVDGLKQFMEINQSILDHPDQHQRFMRDVNGDKFNDFMHVRNKFRKFIEKQYA